MTNSKESWHASLRTAIPHLLITGGSGFIGTNAVEFALQSGISVRNIDVCKPKDPRHNHVWCPCDILDKPRLQKAITEFQPTHVLHLAARTDLDETREISGYSANIAGVAALIESLRGTECRHAIFTSSMLVCRNGYAPRDESDCCPNTLYGKSKVLGEDIVRNSAGPYAWSIVRPTSIWGPWFGPPYRNFFRLIASGYYRHPGTAEVVKALGFAGNCVRQLYRLLTASPDATTGRTFYLADYEPVTTRRWADAIARELGLAPIQSLPLPVVKAVALAGDAAHALGFRNPPLTSFRLQNMLTSSRFDLSPIESISGPLPFTLEQGVQATIAWLSRRENALAAA